MKLTINEIKHLANLSALEFSEEELNKFQEEFNAILTFVDQIEQADVNGELEYETKEICELRDDIVGNCLSQEKVLENAPSKKMGCFNVPLMME